MWQFSKFLATLILREINFGCIQNGKNCQKLSFSPFCRIWILIFGEFPTWKCQKISKNSKFRATKIVKMAVLEVSMSPKLISQKIWVFVVNFKNFSKDTEFWKWLWPVCLYSSNKVASPVKNGRPGTPFSAKAPVFPSQAKVAAHSRAPDVSKSREQLILTGLYFSELGEWLWKSWRRSSGLAVQDYK